MAFMLPEGKQYVCPQCGKGYRDPAWFYKHGLGKCHLSLPANKDYAQYTEYIQDS